MMGKADFLVDISFDDIEISKYMAKRYSQHFLVKPASESDNFRLCKTPSSFVPAFDEMEKIGVKCYFGNLDNVKSILLDYSGLMKEKSVIKSEYWDWFRIDSLHSSGNFDSQLVFGYAAGLLVERLLPSLDYGNGIVHCHGWDSASCALYLKARNAKVKSVISAGNTSLSGKLSLLGKKPKHFEKDAYELGMHAQHQVEKEAALCCNTLVADSKESALAMEKHFGRKPEAIIPYGINLEHFSYADELATRHFSSLENLKEFAKYSFLPYGHIDLSSTKFLFIPENGNMAKSVRALANLNRSLKGSKKSVIAFFFAEKNVNGIKESIKLNKSNYDGLVKALDEHKEKILSDAALALLNGKNPKFSSMDFKCGFSRQGSPEILTHNIAFEGHDSLVRLLSQNKLTNNKGNNVKVLIYAVKPDKKDELLGSDPHDVLAGFHAGIFENIGLKEAIECMALGVPVIHGSSQNKLNLMMLDFVKNGNPRLRIDARKHAEMHSLNAVSRHYVHVHNLTLEKNQ